MTLDERVAEARAEYARARPVSARWSSRARVVMPGGNTRSVLHFEPFPFRVERAESKFLWDVDGHQMIDLLGNYTAGLLGHSPGPVVTAVRDALDSGWSLGAVHANEVRLAELIVDRFPAIEQVRFTNSGTEANLMALALATDHTGRRKIVVFEHGYHGGVLTFGTTAGAVTVPHDWLLLPFNDIDAVDAAFAVHGDEIAAVLVEPMQGSAGCLPPAAGFLEALRDRCDEHRSLLIFDEVMTSRLSTGGAQQRLAVTPDITTLGKYLGGGLSFGAFGASRDVMLAFDPASEALPGHHAGRLGHAGTFNNNVATMAAGVAALTEVITPDRLDATNARGDTLREGLEHVFRSRGTKMCVTGIGSLMNVHGTAGPVRSQSDLATADERLRELLFFALLDAGFYIAPRGFIALSLEVTDDDVAAVVAAVDEWAGSIVGD